MAILDLEVESSPRFLRTLPQELLEEILKRLQNPLDNVRIRSICNLWRSILPSPHSNSIFPLRIPPPPTVSKSYHEYRFFITETNGYLYRPPSCSTKNPLIVVFESTLSRGLFNPCLLYPPHCKISRLNNFPKALDLQDCWIHSLFTAYYVKVAGPTRSKDNEDNVPEKEQLMEDNLTSIDKVVLISYDTITNKSIICNSVYTSVRPELDLSVVVLTGSSELYFLSTQSMNWESSKCDNIKFDDIINYGGMLWAIDEIGGAYVLDDVKSRVMTRAVCSPPHKERGVYPKETSKRRLVEASGQLYMLSVTGGMTGVIRHMTMRFKVYKMKGREWVKVKGVGQHIFYVMKGLCFSAVARRELCLSNKEGNIEQGNIVFVDDRSFGGEYDPAVSDITSFYDDTFYRTRVTKLFGIWGPDFAYELVSRGFAVYYFREQRTRVLKDDELPEMFCSKFFKKSRKHDRESS